MTKQSYIIIKRTDDNFVKQYEVRKCSHDINRIDMDSRRDCKELYAKEDYMNAFDTMEEAATFVEDLGDKEQETTNRKQELETLLEIVKNLVKLKECLKSK